MAYRLYIFHNLQLYEVQTSYLFVMGQQFHKEKVTCELQTYFWLANLVVFGGTESENCGSIFRLVRIRLSSSVIFFFFYTVSFQESQTVIDDPKIGVIFRQRSQLQQVH